MEDIEDLLVGNGVGGAPPGFRLPLASVGFNPKQNKNKPNLEKKSHIQDSIIPGTQVSLSLYMISILCVFVGIWVVIVVFICSIFLADNLYEDFWVLA